VSPYTALKKPTGWIVWALYAIDVSQRFIIGSYGAPDGIVPEAPPNI